MKFRLILKTLLPATLVILIAIIVASPFRVVIIRNMVEAAIRSTTISRTGTTLVAQNSKGFPGTGWVRNLTGSGSTALNKTNCLAAGTTTWAWFEDANGNGTINDPEDGECVKTTTVNSSSWNGANQVTPNTLTGIAATGGSVSTVTAATAWTVDAYKNHSIKITAGTASTCWGIIKSNSATSITVYGGWLTAAHASGCGTPDGTSIFSVYDENKNDNTWIGDYTCTGNFPSGSVVFGSYPTAGTIALAATDCYDGKRDLLPNETDRAVLSGTITATSTNVITDLNLTSNPVAVNDFMGQKVLITSGTGVGSVGLIESNTSNSFTVGSWSSTIPDVGSGYKIIYIIPFAWSSSGTEGMKYKGPLSIEVLKAWKGTRLPTSMDFYGYCGATAGDAYNTGGDSLYHASGATALTTIGNYGTNIGRGRNPSPNDKYMDLSNTTWEWLSEQHYSYYARLAGYYGCSSVNNGNVNSGFRFRAVFRP